MVHKLKLAYQRHARKVGENPKWAIVKAESILNELKHRNYPDPAYISEKCDSILRFVKDHSIGALKEGD